MGKGKKRKSFECEMKGVERFLVCIYAPPGREPPRRFSGDEEKKKMSSLSFASMSKAGLLARIYDHRHHKQRTHHRDRCLSIRETILNLDCILHYPPPRVDVEHRHSLQRPYTADGWIVTGWRIWKLDLDKGPKLRGWELIQRRDIRKVVEKAG